MIRDRYLTTVKVRLSVASTVILKHLKPPKSPQVKEQVNMMVKTASYECIARTKLLRNKD